MSEETIQIKKKDGNDGKGSTFNGVVFTFANSINVLELVEVRTKKTRADADNPNALSQKLSKERFIFNGTSIQLQIGSQEFIAVKFIRQVSEAEFNAKATPQMIEFRKVALSGIGADLKGIAESEKMKNVVANMSSFNSSGEIKNGMQSLQTGAKPTADFSSRCRVVQLLPGAADGSADKLDGAATELTTLFKKGMKSSGNLNKAVFSFGSTSSIFNTLKKHTTLPDQKIKKETEKVLPTTITAKVLQVAKEAISDKSLGKTPADNIVQGVKKEVGNNLPKVKFAGFGLDPAGLIPGAGRSGANSLAQNLGSLLGTLGGKLGDVTQRLSGTAKGVVIPKGISVPNLIEGLDEETGKVSFDTNVSKFIPKGELTRNVKPKTPTIVSSSPSTFKGSSSSGHNFEFVDTVDELVDELASSSRVNTLRDDAISIMVVGFVGDDLYGGPDKMNVEKLHESHLKDDKLFLIEQGLAAGLTNSVATQRADAILGDVGASDDFGIQSHYLILTDGRIQRGRPVSKTRAADRDPYFKNGLELMFVAGGTNPVNAEQLRTFEEFLQRIYKVLPGLNVFGDNEVDQTLLGPGFDVGAFREKFDKDFQIIKDPSSDENKDLDRKTLAIVQPPKGVIAKSTVTQLQTKVNTTNPTTIAKAFETKDPKTGAEIKADIDAELANINNALKDLNTNQNDIASQIEAASAKSFAAAEKGFADLNINNKTAVKDLNVGKVDGFFKRSATKSLDVAKKIKSSLF